MFCREIFLLTMFDFVFVASCSLTDANLRSGKLNAKQRELMDLQKQAQARLARTRERFADGMRDAREVRSDLEWTQKKVT